MLASGNSAEGQSFGQCLAFSLVLGLMGFTSECHAENLVGKRVTVIRWGAEFRSEKNAVVGTSELGKTYEVYSAKGTRLFVRERDGFIMRGDVVPFETASRHFTAAVKRKSSAETYYDRGVFLEDQGEIDDAMKDYDEALRRNPKHPQAYNARAGLWRMKNELDKALEDYGRALRLDHLQGFVYSNRGGVWMAKGDYKRALSDFNDAITANPMLAIAYSNRAAVWEKQDELDKAIEDYDVALRLDPSEAGPLLWRGRLWRRQGDYKKAIADFNELIRRDPNNETAYLDRASAWTDQKVYATAVADYDHLIKLEPPCKIAHVHLAWLLVGCPDAAVRDGKRAMEVIGKYKELVEWDTSLEYHDTLAAAYAELGDFEKAVECQSNLLPRVPDQFKEEVEARLKLYQDQKPYRISVKATGSKQGE